MAPGRGTYLTNLRFADDILLRGRSRKRMKEIRTKNTKRRSAGNSIFRKEVLNNGIVNATPIARIDLQGRHVEIMQGATSTMYLGRLLSSGNLHMTWNIVFHKLGTEQIRDV